MSRYPFLLLFATFLCFSACQVTDHDPELKPPTPALEDFETCPAAVKNFDLVYTEIPGSDSSAYHVEIVTGNYTVEPCMCRVIGYRLEVASLTGGDWRLFPQNYPSYTVPYAPGPYEDTLIINDLEPFLGDGGTSPILGVKNMQKSGIMQRAGGLCIIENFDGSLPPGTPASGAIFVLVPNPPPSTDFYTKTYIPIGMTTN